jgi:hypothetical protein
MQIHVHTIKWLYICKNLVRYLKKRVRFEDLDTHWTKLDLRKHYEEVYTDYYRSEKDYLQVFLNTIKRLSGSIKGGKYLTNCQLDNYNPVLLSYISNELCRQRPPPPTEVKLSVLRVGPTWRQERPNLPPKWKLARISCRFKFCTRKAKLCFSLVEYVSIANKRRKYAWVSIMPFKFTGKKFV